MLAALFACAAALAFGGLWCCCEIPARQTLRLAGAAALSTICLVLILTWS